MPQPPRRPPGKPTAVSINEPISLYLSTARRMADRSALGRLLEFDRARRSSTLWDLGEVHNLDRGVRQRAREAVLLLRGV